MVFIISPGLSSEWFYLSQYNPHECRFRSAPNHKSILLSTSICIKSSENFTRVWEYQVTWATGDRIDWVIKYFLCRKKSSIWIQFAFFMSPVGCGPYFCSPCLFLTRWCIPPIHLSLCGLFMGWMESWRLSSLAVPIGRDCKNYWDDFLSPWWWWSLLGWQSQPVILFLQYSRCGPCPILKGLH